MDFAELHRAVEGRGVGVRSRIALEPLGGPGDKVFPPTYGVDSRADTKYAFEKRRIGGKDVPCVLLDSVASQANRRELALLEAVRDGEVSVPLVTVDFRDTSVAALDRISSLETPHRVFDALLRDSTLDGLLFRLSEVGRAITEATHRNAAPLFRWSPTTLLFGGWDSTGPKGGKGAKYERAITAEITAINAEVGVKTSSRIDPAGIELRAGPIFEGTDGEWTLDEADALRDAKGKAVAVSSGGEGAAGRPSQVNHGNIVPSIDVRAGGITADCIEAVTVLSFPALRRLRFPVDSEGRPLEGDRRTQAEATAHTALAALGLASTVLALDDGFDLRSRCVLRPTSPISFELLSREGAVVEFVLGRAEVLALLSEAVAAARSAGLVWEDEEILLRPTDRLVELVRRSHELAASDKGDSEVD
ncbi:MAG: type I-G CRISPR-associated RAMP protein Csb1/Cas7g [Acidimicrobiales bacterium]